MHSHILVYISKRYRLKKFLNHTFRHLNQSLFFRKQLTFPPVYFNFPVILVFSTTEPFSTKMPQLFTLCVLLQFFIVDYSQNNS